MAKRIETKNQLVERLLVVMGTFIMFSRGFMKSADHRPTEHRPTDHRQLTHGPPTNRPQNHRPTDAIIIFKRLENSKTFTLQNTNTAEKM